MNKMSDPDHTRCNFTSRELHSAAVYCSPNFLLLSHYYYSMICDYVIYENPKPIKIGQFDPVEVNKINNETVKRIINSSKLRNRTLLKNHYRRLN